MKKFNGYPTDDTERFMPNFLAYSVFNRIENDDFRKVAAFQLYLDSPAQLSLRLLYHHYIEDYFSKIMDKGRRLSKNSQEILLKFIEGLPSQLAFLVRAGNPENIQAALTAAKLGEAYGYRATLPATTTLSGATHSSGQQTLPVPTNVCAANRIRADDRFCELEKKLDSLCSQFQAHW